MAQNDINQLVDISSNTPEHKKKSKAKNQMTNIIVHRKWKWHLDIADIDINIDIVS